MNTEFTGHESAEDPARKAPARNEPLKGRGAVSNPHNRYAATCSETFDDGWWHEDDTPSLVTEVINETPKTIVSTNSSPDIPFDQSINPYRGCEHGCIYCYARPSHAYWDMSPGLDFESRIVVKRGAAALLRKKFDHPRYRCNTIAIGANTDPYQPLEATERVTREVLEVLSEYRHPFSIITKSAMILRDIDLLAPMATQRLCTVAVSVTTLDNDLKRKLEPRTASPAARLRAIEKLSAAGIPVTVMVAPVIPKVNDHEMESIVEAAANAGAVSANYIFLRLPLEVSPMFQEWLEAHFPDRAGHVMSLVRQSRDGKDYDSSFHSRMRGAGGFADLIRQRFAVAARRHGLVAEGASERRFELDTSLFRRPEPQLSLF